MELDKNLVFSSVGGVIHSPLQIASDASIDGSIVFSISNLGSDWLNHLGLYARSTSMTGPLDAPADSPPATDYQDILTWGQASHRALMNGLDDVKGGIKVTVPADSDETVYITRGKGSRWTNRIPIPDLSPGSTTSVKVIFEVPEMVDSRRLYIDLVVG